MIEVIVLSIVIGLVAACVFSSQGPRMFVFANPLGAARTAKASAADGQVAVTESFEASASYLEQLQREIEDTLFPRPTDSVLRRHYDSLVAGEVKNRLSFFS